MDHRYGIHPQLMPYVMALTSHPFGLQGAHAEIRNVESGSIITKREKNIGDRFLLIITYCATKLMWQVLMCPHDLTEPPDFIMQDDFLANVDVRVIESQVPSLAHWQPTDPKCLLNVVLELLQLYKQYQGDLLTLNQQSRLCFEYRALSCCLADPMEDLEICVHYQSRVSFLTHLKIDFSKLPTPVPKQKYLILLLIELGENTKNTVSLIKQAELDGVFGNIDLPELKADMILVEYIHLLQNYLQNRVDDVAERLNQRKTLYSLLYQAFEPSILNGDNIMFHSISFLLEVEGFYYVTLIEIPENFPKEQPKITISSMRKHKPGQEIFVGLKSYNYSSEWNVRKIFKKMYDFMKKQAFLQYNKC
ncbi:UNVERIFIED_CONTAM: hypothetical protein PYX00_003105 [Menopon gallinae]|uniref:BRISC and BRCA1-A complex member 2 n=1 Tax=Menopon gallinae TaxID=328185 RepID=A0AAW2I0X6_9NEOP